VAYVIAETCIDVKDGDCTNVCPVECIYEGGRMYYIQPDECVNCGICVSVCPVEAIFDERILPEKWQRFIAINRDFFGDEVTGWGEPGGLSPEFRTDIDHPEVAEAPPQANAP
jgi:ferredoxin